MLKIRKTLVFFCLLILSCSCIQIPAYTAAAKTSYFTSLQRRLVKDGFDKKRTLKLYMSKNVYFETRGVSLYFVHKEGKLNYGQHTEKERIWEARKYMKAHRTELINAEKAFGVDRKIITGIILVETGFGTNIGKRFVFNTLSTMASLADARVRNMLWKKISGSTKLTRKEFEEKANSKSEWAYNELKAFLRYTASEKINPLKIKGSYAGAMGICQFMPSNILTLARDGNRDGRIDLFNHADAIMSIACYLNYYGWRPGIDSKKAYEVVYQYNHSKYYVNTILEIARLLMRK
ncbi:MAG: lytic murein transglycosylase [Desulfobacterales bacterium]|nr:lytic murein transglycosylase [Desulfobacterales bacterium]